MNTQDSTKQRDLENAQELIKAYEKRLMFLNSREGIEWNLLRSAEHSTLQGFLNFIDKGIECYEQQYFSW